jgi:hypothetical protein
MELTKSKADLLEERLIEFAARIVVFSQDIRETTAGRHISQQILRSGTAAAPIMLKRVAQKVARISFTNSELWRRS